MQVTNKQYPALNLANEDDRTENFVIDFVFSSVAAISIAYANHTGFAIGILIYYVVRFLYYLIFEMIFGRTLGQFQTQTKAVNSNNERPSLSQLYIRNSTRFFSLLSALSDEETAIHDTLSHTFVVKDTSLRKLPFRAILISIFVVCIVLLVVARNK